MIYNYITLACTPGGATNSLNKALFGVGPLTITTNTLQEYIEGLVWLLLYSQ